LSEQITGKQTNGDAAFADYSINAGFVYRFGSKKQVAVPVAPVFKDVKN